MTFFMGVDVGSRSCKGVILDGSTLAAYAVIPSGVDYALSARALISELVGKVGIAENGLAYGVSTGLRNACFLNYEYVTDVQCCARGISRCSPPARTIIDIQAQTTQVIRVSESGLVSSFVTTEKCAAGSGRFLDIMANVLRIRLEDIGALSLRSTNPVMFSTGCAVFGESEAISRVAEGATREDILAGVHKAIADKISALLGRVGMEEPIAVCGGGALDSGLIKSIEESLGVRVIVPPNPQLVPALGAGVIAAERWGR